MPGQLCGQYGRGQGLFGGGENLPEELRGQDSKLLQGGQERRIPCLLIVICLIFATSAHTSRSLPSYNYKFVNSINNNVIAHF